LAFSDRDALQIDEHLGYLQSYDNNENLGIKEARFHQPALIFEHIHVISLEVEAAPSSLGEGSLTNRNQIYSPN